MLLWVGDVERVGGNVDFGQSHHVAQLCEGTNSRHVHVLWRFTRFHCSYSHVRLSLTSRYEFDDEKFLGGCSILVVQSMTSRDDHDDGRVLIVILSAGRHRGYSCCNDWNGHGCSVRGSVL